MYPLCPRPQQLNLPLGPWPPSPQVPQRVPSLALAPAQLLQLPQRLALLRRQRLQIPRQVRAAWDPHPTASDLPSLQDGDPCGVEGREAGGRGVPGIGTLMGWRPGRWVAEVSP